MYSETSGRTRVAIGMTVPAKVPGFRGQGGVDLVTLATAQMYHAASAGGFAAVTGAGLFAIHGKHQEHGFADGKKHRAGRDRPATVDAVGFSAWFPARSSRGQVLAAVRFLRVRDRAQIPGVRSVRRQSNRQVTERSQLVRDLSDFEGIMSGPGQRHHTFHCWPRSAAAPLHPMGRDSKRPSSRQQGGVSERSLSDPSGTVSVQPTYVQQMVI